MIKTITLSIFLVLFISGLSVSQSKDEVRLGEGKDETGNTKVKEQSTPTSDQEQKSNTNNSTTERKRIEVKSEPPKLENIENRQVKTNTQTTQTRTNTSNNNSNKTVITSEPVVKDNRDNSNSTTVINIKSDDRGNSGRENESTSQSGVVTIKSDDSHNNSGPIDENTPQSGVVTIREEESNNHAGPVDENTPQSGVVTINNPEIIYTNEEPTITHSNPIPYVETNYDNSSINNNPTIIYNNGQYNYGNPYYAERTRDVIPKKYTEPDASFMLGALKTTTKYPERFNIGTNPVQSGFQFGSRYNIHKIEDISMKGVANLGLNLIGSFNFGFASATDKLIYNDAGVDYDYSTQHYTFVGDLFSLSGNAEYKANVFEDRGIVLGMSVTFFNLGGAATYMSGGRYDEGIFGVVNILPFYLQPYAKLKFMGGTLGVGLQLNPYNFLEYRFGPDNFWGEGESGFHTNSSKISRYAIEAYFKF